MNPSPEQQHPATSTQGKGTHALLEVMEQIHQELNILNRQNVFGFNRIAANALLMQFFKGTAFALGSLVGATIVISILVYFLSQIEVIPILGEWIRELNSFLKEAQH